MVEDENRKVINCLKKQTIKENYGSVEDIKFSPKSCGFYVSSCHRDSIVLITNLTNRTGIRPFIVQLNQGPAKCISWNKSELNTPMFVVGSNKRVENRFEESLKIYEKLQGECKEVYSFKGKSSSRNH